MYALHKGCLQIDIRPSTPGEPDHNDPDELEATSSKQQDDDKSAKEPKRGSDAKGSKDPKKGSDKRRGSDKGERAKVSDSDSMADTLV